MLNIEDFIKFTPSSKADGVIVDLPVELSAFYIDDSDIVEKLP